MKKRILALLLCALTLVGVSACGEESSSEGSTADPTSEEVSTDGGDASKDETSKEKNPEDYVDKDGYQQFLKVSKVDSLLAERGFKDQGENSDYVPLNYNKMKAMWISQYDFQKVYCNGNAQRDEKSFRELVAKAYKNLVNLGFNTVIVQVRPNADSFYPSAYYPYSHYVVGRYGKNATYDPIKIMIEMAHEKNLSFHAWINPMRGMSPANLSSVNTVYPAASWEADKSKTRYLYERADDGLNYLNIAYEDVRNLIIDAAGEIVRHYDVDGVHMDDYFYFGTVPAFDDIELKAAAKEDKTINRQKFRYKNLNTLVSGIYSAIKAENKNVLFGISPAGNLNSMATTYYADVKTWLSQDGYLDYIMPQIYFGMEHGTWSFSDTYERWSAITTNPNIMFTAGMSFGKAMMGYDGTGDENAGAGKDEWIKNKDVFKKCFEYSVKQPNYDGFAIFCYQYLWDPITGRANVKTALELNNCKKYFTDVIKGEPIKYN